jgi:predicted phosphoribosyltransferase
MFRDRADAGSQLAEAFRGRPLHHPLVLAIPRGGVAVGAVLARELGAELDVVLARKLRAPGQPEVALGAVAESGEVYLEPNAEEVNELLPNYLADEYRLQLATIERRKRLLRQVRSAASVAGRSVIVTDDGIATGSTLIAALKVARRRHPRELLVAVPVAAPRRLAEVRRYCDEVICLRAPEHFASVGQSYWDFKPVQDEEVLELLRTACHGPGRRCEPPEHVPAH